MIGRLFPRALTFVPNLHVKRFIIKTELKLYLNKLGLSSTVLSLEHIYKEQWFDYTNSIRLAKPPYEKTRRPSKSVNAMHIKFGETMFYDDNRYVFEVFARMGLRIKDASSGLSKEEFEQIGRSQGVEQSLLSNRAGTYQQARYYPWGEIGFRVK